MEDTHLEAEHGDDFDYTEETGDQQIRTASSYGSEDLRCVVGEGGIACELLT